MKKSLLAVAIAALPAAAFAQTNVTLYGAADIGITSVSDGVNSAMRVDSGMLGTSKWGIRGTESLGGGMNAVFNLEAGFRADTGSGTSSTNTIMDFQRRAIVGLNGSFGEVRLGRDYTPAFLSTIRFDVLSAGLYGNSLNYSAIIGGTSVRFSNAIFYDSPNMGGFSAQAAYTFGEVAGNNSAGRGFSLAGSYAAGPLMAGLYYENTNNATGDSTKKIGVGGGYNFGAFGLKASWQKMDPPLSGDNVTYWSLGGNVAVGAGQVLAQYSRASAETGGGRSNTFGLAYTYPMSKRTTLYATVGQASNNATATPTLGNLRSSDNTVTPAANGQNARGIGIGLAHSF